MANEAVESVRAAVKALNEGDVDGYFRYFDPSCKRWVAGMLQPLALSDIRNGFLYLASAFKPLHLGEDGIFGDERFVCARWRMRGVHVGDYMGVPPLGREIAVETCEIYEVGQTGVVAVWTYGDPGQLLSQIKG